LVAEQAKEKLDRIPHVESLLITIAAPCEIPAEKTRSMVNAVRELFPHARILAYTCALKIADLRLDTEKVMQRLMLFDRYAQKMKIYYAKPLYM